MIEWKSWKFSKQNFCSIPGGKMIKAFFCILTQEMHINAIWRNFNTIQLRVNAFQRILLHFICFVIFDA